MPRHLTPEQLDALRAVPLGSMPNKLTIALALSRAKQADLAEETGINVVNVSRFVTGKYGDMTITTAGKIAGFFGCQIEDLFPARQAVA